MKTTFGRNPMNDNMMWALVKEKPEQGLWMKRVPIPEVGPNDVKIKIRKSAINKFPSHVINRFASILTAVSIHFFP